MEELKKHLTQRAQGSSRKIGPKRPLSAYVYYLMKMRFEVVKKFPGIKPTEAIKKLAALWRNTTEEERQPYYELFKADSERYQRQMNEYFETGIFHDDQGNEVKFQYRCRRALKKEAEKKREPSKPVKKTRGRSQSQRN